MVVLFTIIPQVKTNTKFTMNLQKNFKIIGCMYDGLYPSDKDIVNIDMCM